MEDQFEPLIVAFCCLRLLDSLPLCNWWVLELREEEALSEPLE